MIKEEPVINQIKAWAFAVLVPIVGYFGHQTLAKVDVVVEKLSEISVTVKALEIQQSQNSKDIDKHDTRIQELERDHTSVCSSGRRVSNEYK